MENIVENKANKPSIFKRAKNKAVAYAGLASLALFSAPASADSVEVNSAFADLYKTVRDAMQGTVGARYSAHLHVKSVERSVSSSGSSMSGMANVGFDMRLTDDMSVGATIGYEISHYEFGVKPSTIYGITTTQSKSFNIGAINVGISMSAAF